MFDSSLGKSDTLGRANLVSARPSTSPALIWHGWEYHARFHREDICQCGRIPFRCFQSFLLFNLSNVLFESINSDDRSERRLPDGASKVNLEVLNERLSFPAGFQGVVNNLRVELNNVIVLLAAKRTIIYVNWNRVHSSDSSPESLIISGFSIPSMRRDCWHTPSTPIIRLPVDKSSHP